jgi:MFS family permease
MKQIPLGKMIILNSYWVGLSFMWNVIHPIMLPAVLRLLVPNNQKNTVLGLLTFVGLMLAMVIQPISGALSDRWVSKWGRRRPLITLGTLFDFVFLAILAWAGGLLWVFVGYIGLQISSNIAHGPLQGLLPDQVPSEQLGTASSIKIFIDMFVMAAATIIAGFLIDPNSTQPVLIMLIVIGLLAITGGLTILGTKEKPYLRKEGEPAMKTLLGTFKIDFRANTSYWLLIALRFVFLFGIYGVQRFAQNFIGDVLQAANPALETGIIMGALTLALLIFAVVAGWLNDRFDSRIIMTTSAIITAAGCLLLMTARTRISLIGFGSIIGMGMGLFLTSNWALANRLAPPDEAGKYIGLTNIATAGAGALAGLLGPVIDHLNSTYQGNYYGYVFLFGLGAVCALASLIFLKWIHNRKILTVSAGTRSTTES